MEHEKEKQSPLAKHDMLCLGTFYSGEKKLDKKRERENDVRSALVALR